MNITGSNNTKHYVEFAKAWLNDKDIDEGKMWYYYIYVMCDKIREAEMECYEEELEKHEGEEEPYGMFRRGSRGGRGRRGMNQLELKILQVLVYIYSIIISIQIKYFW